MPGGNSRKKHRAAVPSQGRRGCRGWGTLDSLLVVMCFPTYKTGRFHPLQGPLTTSHLLALSFWVTEA